MNLMKVSTIELTFQARISLLVSITLKTITIGIRDSFAYYLKNGFFKVD